MKKLETIQKEHNLNEVFIVEEGHRYLILRDEWWPVGEIKFQKGPRNLESSTDGVLDNDLLEIVKNRMEIFQAGEFSCQENSQVLKLVSEALQILNNRVKDRASRNVLGKNEK